MDTQKNHLNELPKYRLKLMGRASDLFLDWWAEVTLGAEKGGSFSGMMGPSISN